MAKLRLTVGSLRRMVSGLSRLMSEAEEDPWAEKTDPEPAAEAEVAKQATKDAFRKLLDVLPKGVEQTAMSPEKEKEYKRALTDFNQKYDAEKKITGDEPNPKYKEALRGSFFSKELGHKRAGKPPPTNPSYDPLLPSKHQPKSPGWLGIYSPEAAEALKAMGSPAGKIYIDKAYITFKPDDTSEPSMFWVGVPEKKKVLPGGAVEMPKDGGEKPHAWRTYAELDKDQRLKLGWADPRDRGTARQGPDYGQGEKEKPAQPLGSRVPQDVEAMGIRVKGAKRYAEPNYVWNEKGELEELPFGVSPEPEVMGFVPGAEHGTPGKGGGVPSLAASVAAQRGLEAKHAKLPDWNKLSMDELKKADDIFKRKYKMSQDPADKRVILAIQSAIEDREAGIEPQRAKPEVRKTPRFTGTPEEKWGKRKKWGQTSPNPEVTKVERPKK